jgi:hypothetical protein
MQSLTSVDWAILDFLGQDPKPIHKLLEMYPRSTLYYRFSVLRGRGLVVKRGAGYALTTAGYQLKTQREAETGSDALLEIYAPLRELPSPQHRAVAELSFAARALRHHTDQADRHAGFLLLGPTLTGKTSEGEFLCWAAGVDPATHVVDLASESGRSLFVRRGAAGQLVSQRQLLEAPLVVFDEFQQADAAVRRAVAAFLNGRRQIPVENTVITIAPVSIVIMNPTPGPTLSARTGLSVPQLRRLVPCDFGVLDLAHLALEGPRAVRAAERAGPVALPPPRASCEGFRSSVVGLLRQVLDPTALAMVDVDLLLGLGRGLTGCLAPSAAIRLVLFDYLLAVETLAWTKAGWLDRLHALPPAPAEGAGETGLAVIVDGRHEALEAKGPRIRLFPERAGDATPREERAMTSRESIMPTLTLSEHTKLEIAWLCRETGFPPDRLIPILGRAYVMLVKEKYRFVDLDVIVALREQCDAVDVPVADLRTFLEQTTALKRQGLDVEDVGTALEVVEQLSTAGLTLDQARAVADLIAALRDADIDLTVPEQLRTTLDQYRALGYAPDVLERLAKLHGTLTSLGLTPDDLDPRLRHLERLTALGLDLEAADTLATALDATAMAGEQRAEVVRRLPEIASGQIALDEIRAQQERLRQAREGLITACAKGRQAAARVRKRLASLGEQERTLTERIAALQKECLKLQDAIVAARALETFLLTSIDLAHPIWRLLDQVRAFRERRPGLPPGGDVLLTHAIKQEVARFLERIASMHSPSPPALAP